LAKFNKLDVPHQWRDEFTKYPHGYTIFEALCKWVKQVDNMVDNINNWNDYLDNFVENFEFELQEEVQSTIERWQSEGLLDGIIESALNTEIDNVNTQMAENKQKADIKISKVNNQIYGGVINRRPLIVIESDDALIQDYDVLRPFLAEQNVPCTISIPTALVDSNPPTMMSWGQIRELVDNYGWDVASHTHNNLRLTPAVTIEQIENEFKLSKETLEREGLNSDHFTYVGGVYDDRTVTLSRKYFKSSALTARWPGNYILPLRSHSLSRSSLYSLTLEHLKEDIDNAVHHNGLLIIYTHGNDFAANPELQTKLSDAIDYAKSLGVEFVTRTQAIEELGNIVETSPSNNVGGLQITKTGQVYQNGEEITSFSPDTFAFTRDPENTGTYCVTGLKGFPKHLALLIHSDGGQANSVGFASFVDIGESSQFCSYTREGDGGKIGTTTAVGVMAVDNANQVKVTVIFSRYEKQILLTFEKVGTGYTGNMVCLGMIYY